MDEIEAGDGPRRVQERIVTYPAKIYTEIAADGKPSGKWSRRQFETAVEIVIESEDFEDWSATAGGIFEIESGKAVKVGNRDEYCDLKKTEYEERQQAAKLIKELESYLNTEWRWRQERFYWESREIVAGIRESTTETEESLMLDRKRCVDELNKLKAPEETL